MDESKIVVKVRTKTKEIATFTREKPDGLMVGHQIQALGITYTIKETFWYNQNHFVVRV